MKPQVINLCFKICVMVLCTNYLSEITEFDPQKRNDFLFLVEPTSKFSLIQCYYVPFISYKTFASSTIAWPENSVKKNSAKRYKSLISLE